MPNLLMISGDRALAAGKQAAFFNTLSEFHKHWDRIDVICPRSGPHRYDMVVFGNVHVHPSPWPLIFQPLWIWWKGKQLSNTTHYPLFTCHEYPPFYNGIGAWLLHRATRIPYVLEIMHIEGWPKASGLRERFYRWLRWMFTTYDARRARAVRVINEHETPDFLVAAGVPRSKMVTLPAIYVDLATFKPDPEAAKRFDLVFVGRLAHNKGLDLFMEVARRTGLRALVVGDGPLSGWARRKARRERISVVFHGFAKDAAEVAGLINQARLLVMTSLNEGGPRVVLEALACGTPVLATPVGIVRDVLPPEAIEEWDAQALADKAQNILNDRELYGRLRESGLLTAQKFERSVAIAAYADGLKKLL